MLPPPSTSLHHVAQEDIELEMEQEAKDQILTDPKDILKHHMRSAFSSREMQGIDDAPDVQVQLAPALHSEWRSLPLPCESDPSVTRRVCCIVRLA